MKSKLKILKAMSESNFGSERLNNMFLTMEWFSNTSQPIISSKNQATLIIDSTQFERRSSKKSMCR